MRKVTREVVGAFLMGRKRTIGNTSTDGTTLTLHGNVIAEKRPDGSIVATLAGWPTVTTRDRLNGLCESLGKGRFFHQRKNCQFFGKVMIGSKDTIILHDPNGGPVTSPSKTTMGPVVLNGVPI